MVARKQNSTKSTHVRKGVSGLFPACAFLCLLAAAVGCRGRSDPEEPVDPGRNGDGAYAHTVDPIFRANCVRCHNAASHKGGLRLDSYAALMRGGRDGAVILPGDPGHSLLITLIRHAGPADKPMPMPPKGKLSDADIATITQWVQNGASRDK